MKNKRNWHKMFRRIAWVISIPCGICYPIIMLTLEGEEFSDVEKLLVFIIGSPLAMGSVWLIYAMCYGFYELIRWIISALNED